MFPLPRMLEYGNTYNKPIIKKALGATQSAFVLMENGDVWVAGANNYGELGLGNFTGWNGMTPEWTKVLTGVDDIWTSEHAYGILFLQSGKYKYMGYGRPVSASGNVYTPYITNLDTIVQGNTIRDIIVTNYNLYVLIRLPDGTDRVYACGYGSSLGNGVNANTTVFVESTVITNISTNIMKISANKGAFYFLVYQATTDGYDEGTLYGLGMNNNNQLSSTGLGTIILSPVILLTGCFDVKALYDAWAAVNGTSGALYGAGSNAQKQLLNTTTATITPARLLGFSIGLGNKLYAANTCFVSFMTVDNRYLGRGSLYNVDSTMGVAGVDWTPIYTWNSGELPNYSTSYGISFWGTGGDWYFSSNNMRIYGITGEDMGNGTYKIPDFYK